jgi:undecaprenyl-phosphate galactose phosphotransferase
MKEIVAKIVLIAFDIATAVAAVAIAYLLRQSFDPSLLPRLPGPVTVDPAFFLLHIITIITLMMEGIYTRRYDFWQEYRRIGRALLIACALILAVLALVREIEAYSRFILIGSFVVLFILLPLQKYLLKRWLYRIRVWGRGALVMGEDPFFEQEVFGNPYLGYIPAHAEEAKTLFIAPNRENDGGIEAIVDATVKHQQEVIFIPLIKSYDFSDSHIIHLFNARTNLVVLENKLMGSLNRSLKSFSDYLLSLLLLPFALIAMGIIALLIKRSEPSSPVFFLQKRLGRDGAEFVCYKFRSMRCDGEEMLEAYLREHPEEVRNYEIYHKYDNDPRVTPIGRFLRKTSLDELPQILNVIRGEMSLIGPRPYMTEEEAIIGNEMSVILAVKPGITGMWQVSGRSDVDFESRVALDVWYVRNWSLWNDFVILVKTVKVVWKREGAL